MPAKGVALKPYAEILRYEQIEKIARITAGLGISKIRLTGGEPLVRKNITYLVQQLSLIQGLAEINMTSNGSLLTPALARSLKQAGLTRINISLDTLEPEKFATISRGGRLDDVLRGIFAAREADLRPIKINMVISSDTAAEEIATMRSFCEEHQLSLQTIEQFSLRKSKDPAGTLIADRPPRCLDCNRLRITADGFIKPCLFSGHEIRIDFADIEQSLRTAVLAKPARGRSCSNRPMCRIGGEGVGAVKLRVARCDCRLSMVKQEIRVTSWSEKMKDRKEAVQAVPCSAL
jgi:cyclic pyranopterin phosphate synthase